MPDLLQEYIAWKANICVTSDTSEKEWAKHNDCKKVLQGMSVILESELFTP